MKKRILGWLGLDPHVVKTHESLGRAQVLAFREDAQLLTTAVEFLATKLNETVTREEVTAELNARLERLETAHAAALSGTKNQMRRTRTASMWLWTLMLVIGSFFTIQIHDLHVVHCTLTPPTSAGKDFVCEAAFPFADHSSTDLLHQLLNASGDRNGVGYPDPIRYEHPLPPRVVGATAYALLLSAGLAGAMRYRSRLAEEEGLEVGDVTSQDLVTLKAAQDDETVAPGRRSQLRRPEHHS